MAGLLQQGKELANYFGDYFGDVAGNYGDALSSLFNPPLPPVKKPQGPVAWGRQVGVDYNQEMKSTPRSIRNNNPLSVSLIEGGANSPGGSDPWEGLAQRQTDVKLPSEQHGMLQFKDPLHGVRAGYINLRTQVNRHGADTMQKLVTRHIAGNSPYSEQTPNKKAEIDQAVSVMRRHTNLGKNEKINMSDMKVASGVFKALAMHETGREGNEFEMTLPDELITAGIGMALQPQYEDKLANARNFITTASGILPPTPPRQPSPQQQYEAARMNRPPLTQPQMQPQMAVPDKSHMYPPPKTLEEVNQTAQIRPVLQPFRWGSAGGGQGLGRVGRGSRYE